MTYDAVLVARRGLGADELRLASPAFLDAVRWSVFAEKISEPLEELGTFARQDATGIAPKDLPAFIKARNGARDEVKRRRVILLLEEPDHPPAEANGD